MQTYSPLVLTRPPHQHISGGHYWYSKPGCVRYSHSDMLKVIKGGDDIKFENGPEEFELLGILSMLEKGASANQTLDRLKDGDKQLLYRIIRAGGFVRYIRGLENALP